MVDNDDRWMAEAMKEARLAEAEGTGIPAAFHCEKIVAICHYLTGKNLLENRQNDGKMQKFFVRFAYGL